MFCLLYSQSMWPDFEGPVSSTQRSAAHCYGKLQPGAPIRIRENDLLQLERKNGHTFLTDSWNYTSRCVWIKGGHTILIKSRHFHVWTCSHTKHLLCQWRENQQKKNQEKTHVIQKQRLNYFVTIFGGFFCLFTNWERILTWLILKYDLTV